MNIFYKCSKINKHVIILFKLTLNLSKILGSGLSSFSSSLSCESEPEFS